MVSPADNPRGLSASELAAAVRELHAALAGATVVDVAALSGNDDLLLFLRRDERKYCLHIAPGGNRARVTLTTSRFPKDAFATSPRLDALNKQLAGATLQRVVQPDGERRCTLWFMTRHGDQRLEIELFGPRGLWALCDSAGVLRELSRPVATAVRTLQSGDGYIPPPAGGSMAPLPERFTAPVLAAIDLHFSEQDRTASAGLLREQLARALQRGMQKQQDIEAGLQRQLAEGAAADQIRAEADMLLAYAHRVPRGATELVVPDPFHDGEELHIALDPALPVTLQAKARYERARRLCDGAVITQQRLEAATALAVRCQELLRELPDADAGHLEQMTAELQRLSLLPKPKTQGPGKAKKPVPTGENFRRFVSAEGYPILVGRNNEQNDRLTRSVAGGNDLWLHIGGGHAGSHVVIKLPKQKTASLETMLDAGTLAVHFSKARGARLIEVIYTFAKNVRKPKGLPPGAVVPSQTRTLAVRLDEARLQRLLDSAGERD